MIHVHFTIHGELHDHLPIPKRSGRYTTPITSNSSLFDAVQAQGIPHCEVGGLRLNMEEAGWNNHIADRDAIEVFPFLPLETSSPLGAPPLPLPPTFLLDVHLGRLAGYLRLCGFDTAYHAVDRGDRALVHQVVEESRILLTCDRHLLMHRAVPWGRLLRSRDPIEQMCELLDHFLLRRQAQPFTRCMTCNSLLRLATTGEICSSSPPLVRIRYGLDTTKYQSCEGCNRLFWAGTHTDRMRILLTGWGIES